MSLTPEDREMIRASRRAEAEILALPDPHAAALDNLADAIRELAAALNRTLTPQDTPAEDGSPGPAKGLITQIRPNPDWRPRGAARRIVGFTHDQEASDG